MARDSNGAHTLPSGNPVVSGTTIEATWANDTMSDISTEVTNSLDRAGRGGMTGQLKAAAGTKAAPGITWTADVASGWYRAGSGDYRWSLSNADILRITSGGLAAWDGTAWDYYLHADSNGQVVILTDDALTGTAQDTTTKIEMLYLDAYDKVRLPAGAFTTNNVAVGGYKAAGTSRLDIAKINTSDEVQIGDTGANLRAKVSTTFYVDGNLSVSGSLSGASLGRLTYGGTKTSSFNATVNEYYYVDTSSGAVTCTLPATPTVGNRIGFVDLAGKFDTYGLVLSRNGEKIMRTAENMTIDIVNFSGVLEYTGSTYGWLALGGMA